MSFFDLDPAWPWMALSVIAAFFTYMAGRIRERLRWIRLLQNPPRWKDLEWFERRVIAPFRDAELSGLVKAPRDADYAAQRSMEQSARTDGFE